MKMWPLWVMWGFALGGVVYACVYFLVLVRLAIWGLT